MGLTSAALLSLLLFAASNTYLNRVQKQTARQRLWKSALFAAIPLFLLGAAQVGGITAMTQFFASALFASPLLSSVSTFWSKRQRRERDPKKYKVTELTKAIKRQTRRNSLLRSLADRLELNPERSRFGDFMLDFLSKRLDLADQKLQALYLKKGIAENDYLKVDNASMRFISVSRVKRPDGGFRYEVGYDLNEGQLNDIKTALAKEFGVNVDDPKQFAISSERNAKLGNMFGSGREGLFFDKKDGVFQTTGADLDGLKVSSGKGKSETEVSVSDFVENANNSLHKKGLSSPKEAAKLGYPGGLHMEVLGNTAVSISMGGVALAYAVAGEDGKLRLQGTDGLEGGLKQKKLVNYLNRQLKDAQTIQEWCNKAKDIIATPENIDAINKGIADKTFMKDSVKHRKNMRKKIMNVNPDNVKSITKGLKR